jgi:predicted DNA-binding transcriptional regulator AlpA
MDPAKIDYVRNRRETAKILGVSVRTLRRMEARGDAPPRVRITERIIGFRDSAIDAFLEWRLTVYDDDRTANVMRKRASKDFMVWLGSPGCG